LLPISALTEGRRYLYLPSAVTAIALGVGIAQLRGRWQHLALSGVAIVLAVSSWRIAEKVQDWRWAGKMTAEGARLVDDTLAPSCDTGHVVFLTSPVGVRGVYTHFYYETFELPRGCIPATFQVVARVLHVDTQVEARWLQPNRIVFSVPDYRGNLVVSQDLRRFDLPLAPVDTRTVQTPLGELRAEAVGGSARLALTLAPTSRHETPVLFYYSNGGMHRLPAPVQPQ
jgi:hypothetical protein